MNRDGQAAVVHGARSGLPWLVVRSTSIDRVYPLFFLSGMAGLAYQVVWSRLFHEIFGVTVYAVGLGTNRGAPIPIKDAEGRITGYKKDREDRVVTTRLDETALEQLALATDGFYARSTSSGLEVEAEPGLTQFRGARQEADGGAAPQGLDEPARLGVGLIELAGQAHRVFGLSGWYDLFDQQLVRPTVAKVVLVEERAPLLPRDPAQLELGFVAHCEIVIVGIGRTKVRSTDDELVHVRIGPAHDDLDDVVQPVQGGVTTYLDPSPDGRIAAL